MVRPVRIGAVVRPLLAGIIAVTASFAFPVFAQPSVLSGTVVRIEERDLFLDVGTPAAREGLELDVYRSIEVRHPVTKRVLRDRFVIGRLAVVQPGETLSIARLRATPARTVEVGDVVEAPAPLMLPTGPGPASPVAAVECPPSENLPCPPCDANTDPETAEIVSVWRATLGRTPEERVRLYEIFVRRNPRTRWLSFVQTEVNALRRFTGVASVRAAPQPPTAAQLRQLRVEALIESIDVMEMVEAREGDPIEIAVRIEPDAGVQGLVLYAAALPPGSVVDPHLLPEVFQPIPMVLDGRGHARARVPEAIVHPPGFAYFIDAVGTDGITVPVHGQSTAPERVSVRTREPEGYDPRGRSRVRAQSEWVSFDGTSQRDWYLLMEGEFLYRLRWLAFHGLRVGYGHYRGMGGTVEALDVRLETPTEVGYTYGYVETELRIGEIFAVMARGTLGLAREQFDAVDANRVNGGFQLRVRIGSEEGTNLVMAGETIPEIGQRAFLGLAWESIPNVPMAAEVHVTDQPVNSGELGVRGVFEVGWKPIESVAIAARFSYQGRTIDHAGPGAGIAATFDW